MPLRLNWISAAPGCPWWQENFTPPERRFQEELADKVRKAVSELSADERLVVERHYFEGMSFPQIALERRVTTKMVRNSHRRALRRLRKLLASCATGRFGMNSPATDCPICASEHRRVAEDLIAAKERHETYGALIEKLWRLYQIRVISPKTITGHTKYHC